MKAPAAIALAVSILLPLAAGAGEPRFALVVGNNEGGRFEKELRYSEDDARKVRDVLTELGRFKSPKAFRFVAELPKGPSGKVQRLKLAAEAGGADATSDGKGAASNDGQ